MGKEMYSIIREMRLMRKTYQEIADALNISKQRVHSIYKNYNTLPRKSRKEINDRDRGFCIVCDSTDNIEIHHINGVRSDNRIENLISLCRQCHIGIEREIRLEKTPEEKYYKFTPEKRKKAIELRNKGFSLRKVGKMLEVSYEQIRKVTNSLAIDKSK